MDVRTESLAFAGHGGDELPAFLAEPDDAPPEGGRPGIVLVHEVYGPDPHLRGVARRLAAEGFVVWMADLYAREGVPGPVPSEADPAPAWPAETIAGAVAALPDRRATADLDAAAAALGERPGVDPERLAVLGFCMGGTLAFLLGCTSTRVAAVVDFYGGPLYRSLSAAKPTQPLELALNLDAPLLALFGADDPYIPAEDVEYLRAALAAGAKHFEIHTYPGVGHGFFNEARSGHDAAAAEDAWGRTLAFLREVL